MAEKEYEYLQDRINKQSLITQKKSRKTGDVKESNVSRSRSPSVDKDLDERSGDDQDLLDKLANESSSDNEEEDENEFVSVQAQEAFKEDKEQSELMIKKDVVLVDMPKKNTDKSLSGDIKEAVSTNEVKDDPLSGNRNISNIIVPEEAHKQLPPSSVFVSSQDTSLKSILMESEFENANNESPL